jgi:hypothetical protein
LDHLFVCFFPGIFVTHTNMKCFVDNPRLHKEATNQSLNQKSRCFYIGAFFFSGAGQSPARAMCAQTLFSVATLTHTAYQHFNLLGYISTREFDGWDSDSFKTYRSTAYVADEVNVVVVVLSTGTVVFA